MASHDHLATVAARPNPSADRIVDTLFRRLEAAARRGDQVSVIGLSYRIVQPDGHAAGLHAAYALQRAAWATNDRR